MDTEFNLHNKDEFPNLPSAFFFSPVEFQGDLYAEWWTPPTREAGNPFEKKNKALFEKCLAARQKIRSGSSVHLMHSCIPHFSLYLWEVIVSILKENRWYVRHIMYIYSVKSMTSSACLIRRMAGRLSVGADREDEPLRPSLRSWLSAHLDLWGCFVYRAQLQHSWVDLYSNRRCQRGGRGFRALIWGRYRAQEDPGSRV